MPVKRIEQFLVRSFLPRLLTRACPSTIHTSGEEGEAVNCFSSHLPDGDDPDLVLLRCDGEEVRGLKYDGTRFSADASIAFRDIDPRRLRITHYYGLDRVEYAGIWGVAIGLTTGWPYAVIHWRRLRNRVTQRLFNRRRLVIRKHLDILQQVVDLTVGGGNDAVDALDLMTDSYGEWWATHPGWGSHHSQLERHLELLVQSGELEKWDTRYRPTGQALKTLEESEDADRKHSANLRVQWGLAFLTLLALAMAAAQAGLIKLPVLLDLT